MELREQRHDLVAGVAIKSTSGLVGQNQRGPIDDSPRDSDALLLAAGELVRPVAFPMGQADPFQSLVGSAVPLVTSDTAVEERQLDVFQRGRTRQERRQMEDEPDLPVPDVGAPTVEECRRLLSTKEIATGIRSLQQRQEVHQSGFARTRAAADGQKLALAYGQRNIGNRIYE